MLFPNKPRLSQRGFTLIEVMSAAMILSILVLGIGSAWVVADRDVTHLMNRQKAIFAADTEMERLTALYATTSFGFLGPATTTGYTETPTFPSTRLAYPNGLTPYLTGDNDYTTSSATGFQTGSPFQVWVNTNLLSSLNRNYVWLDQAHNVMARLSWTVTNITPSSCVVGGDRCACLNYLGFLGGSCQMLVLYLEYPYRLTAGAPVSDSNLQTISLATIVGRHT
jgi:prepilin-type N-terminal cleavage/methylation domain-containing protein